MYWLKLSVIFTFKIISEHNYLLLSHLFIVNFVLNNTRENISQMKCFQVDGLYHLFILCHKYDEAAQISQPSCFTSLRVNILSLEHASDVGGLTMKHVDNCAQ